MTSNLGSEVLGRDAVGFAPQKTASETERLRQNVEEALKRTFRPEFLNRIDEIVVFDPLTQDDILKIVDKMVDEVQGRLNETGIRIELTPAAVAWLAKDGFDRLYGARPLKRSIQRNLENQLSKRILSGEFAEGTVVSVDANEDGLSFSVARSKAKSR